MITVLSWLLTILSITSIAADIAHTDARDKTLKIEKPALAKSPEYWHIYRIGADLTQKIIADHQVQPVILGVMDAGFGQHLLLKHSISTHLENEATLRRKEDMLHGTHVLGTISGQGAFSVAYPCKISLHLGSFHKYELEDKYVWGLKLDSGIEEGNKLTKDTKKFLDHFRAQNVRIISRSFCFGDVLNRKIASDETLAEFKSFTKEGRLIVNGAGNTHLKIAVQTPDESHGLLLVANIDNLGIYNSSSFGDQVFLAAPGTDIISVEGDFVAPHDRLIPMTGTSMATPLVTGTIVAMLGMHPVLDNDSIVQILKETAIKRSAKRNHFYGFGILNNYGAIKATLLVKQGHKIGEALDILKEESKAYAKKGQENLTLALEKKSSDLLKSAEKSIRKAYFLDPSNLLRKQELHAFQQKFGYEQEAKALAFEMFYTTGNYALVENFSLGEKDLLVRELKNNKDALLQSKDRENIINTLSDFIKAEALKEPIREDIDVDCI